MIDFLEVSIHFTGEPLFDRASFKINALDRVALVGANGTGKSTILKLMKGIERPSEGKINRIKNLSAGYLPQEFVNYSKRKLFDEVKNSIVEIVDIELRELEIKKQIELETNNKINDELIHEMGELEILKEKLSYYSIHARIEKVLFGLGFSKADLTRHVNEFSGGWQMRIEMAKILLGNNSLILMDEPTNHLDFDSLQWVINYLKSFNGGLVVVSHDRYFIDQVTNKTLEIFNKKISFYNGNYQSYLKLKEERDKQLLAEFKNQERKIKQTERFIERFRYKATKARQVQSRIKQLEKIDRIDLPEFESEIEIKFPPPPRSGEIIAELNELSKSFESKKVFDNVNLQILRGEKIAFIGPNGAGKTTLAKIIANKLKHDSGKYSIGHNTLISYYAQEVADNLDMGSDLLDIISKQAPDYTPGQIRNLLGSFLFSDDDVFKKIKVLSGGEKSRVALAKILVTSANLIVLDEPTNHLDYNSKKVLQKALLEYKGSLILVSHDIDFLRPVVDKVFELRNGTGKLFYGGIDYYIEKIENELNLISEGGSKPKNNNQRKEQKRIEAQIRQDKYTASKILKSKVNLLEKLIVELELSKKQLEDELSSHEIFSNPSSAKNTNLEYDLIKQRLEKAYRDWTNASHELEEIESKFTTLS